MANVTHAIATQEVRGSETDWLVANRLLLFDRKSKEKGGASYCIKDMLCEVDTHDKTSRLKQKNLNFSLTFFLPLFPALSCIPLTLSFSRSYARFLTFYENTKHC
jgi:hypothetical protein